MCSDQLSLLSSAARERSSSLRATRWRPSVADWGGGSMSARRGSNCSLVRAMDDRIMRRGIISSCQSAATSEIAKALLGMCSSWSSAISSTYGPLPLSLNVIRVVKISQTIASSGSVTDHVCGGNSNSEWIVKPRSEVTNSTFMQMHAGFLRKKNSVTYNNIAIFFWKV